MPNNPFKLPYGRQSIDEADIEAVVSVLRDDWVTQGPRVAAFERSVAAKVGARHGVAVSSGTAALHSACHAAGLKEGCEAIVPALTFAATAAAVRLTGAEVRFADIDPETLCLSPESAEAALTGGSRAILPVDFAGQPCRWKALSDLASARSLVTIADAAHSLGGEYEGRPVGSLADMSCFSFHPVKAITTAEGGMTVTDSELYRAELLKLRGHGIVRDPAQFLESAKASEVWDYEIQAVGLNYRISDIQCALGISQLRKLDDYIARRGELAALYSATLANSDLLNLPKVACGRKSAWHIYVVRLNLEALSVSRAHIFEELRAQGLGVQVHYKPLHLHPYYRRRYSLKRGDFPNAEAFYGSAITLPLFPAMADQDVLDVCQIVNDVLHSYRR